MHVVEQTSDLSDIRADLKAVIGHITSGRSLDPAIRSRILDRSGKLQNKLLEKHGVREIAVDLIRQGRDEEDVLDSRFPTIR